MIATKKSYELSGGTLVEITNGSLIGIEWVNANGNTLRCYTNNILNANNNRSFRTAISKEIKPVGEASFIPYGSYELIADDYTYRSLTTGLKVPKTEATTEVLDVDNLPTGEYTINAGYCTDATFFILMIGYNVNALPLSLYDYIYIAVAEKEGVTFS